MGRPIVRPICDIVQRSALRAISDLTVTGMENVPRNGPLILVANHQSNIDPPLIGAIFPRRVWFLAKASIFENPVSNWFLRSWGAFPLRRGEADVGALRWIMGKLSQGEVVMLFPEGTRNPGAMGEAQPGVSQLALKMKVPLVPIGITGTERYGSVTRVFSPTGKLSITVGEPFNLPHSRSKQTQEQLESLTGTIMARIAELLPETYRGNYALMHSDAASVERDAATVEPAGS